MKKTKEAEDTESFESAFKKLEAILNKLENEIPEYSIDKILKEYEEGVRLLKICRAKLRDAELRIEKIGAEEEEQK
jgi:exodeoxyribonuclease VII small subunit